MISTKVSDRTNNMQYSKMQNEIYGTLVMIHAITINNAFICFAEKLTLLSLIIIIIMLNKSV